MTKQSPLLFTLVLFCFVYASCTQQRSPCLTPKSASLILQTIHYKADTSTIPVDTVLPAAIFFPVSTQQNDLVYIAKQSNFTLSLSPDSTFCQWLFKADTVASYPYDTVSFYYKRNPKFLSNACGFTYFYDIDSLHTTHNSIDSVRILNTSVTNNVNTKHLQIYIHRNF